MHLLLCLRAALLIHSVLAVPRIESQSPSAHHLLRRVGGEPAPVEEPGDKPVPVYKQPGIEGSGDEPTVKATFDPGDLRDQLPSYDFYMPKVAKAPSDSNNEVTTLTDDGDGTLSLRFGTEDAEVAVPVNEFAKGLTGATEYKYVGIGEPTSKSAGSAERRRAALQKLKGQLQRKALPKNEAAVGARVPSGQAIRFATVMKGHTWEEGTVTVDINKLRAVELKDNPYYEDAEKYDTVPDRTYENGRFVSKIINGKSRFFWEPYDKRSLDSPKVRSRLSKRQNAITTIETVEGQSASGQKNNTENFSAEFQKYANTYDAVQANITELLVPFLASTVQSTNDSFMIDIAWSVYTQLTGSTDFVAGPFMYGMHCLDSLEEQYFKNNNISSNATNFDTGTLEYLAYHQMLLDTYTALWINGTAAVNQSSQLSDLALLTSYLTPTDTSVAPGGWFTTATNSYDDTFFETFGLKAVHNSTSSRVRF